MADSFLRELFRAHNRVQNSEEDCIICTEKCGTMNEETGRAEFAIRLPCKHIVGSGCIAQWLRSHNNCPLCRHIFFPGEHGVSEPQTHHVPTHQAWTRRGQMMGGSIEDTYAYIRELNRLCEQYCVELSLRPDVAYIAGHVFTKIFDSRSSNTIFQSHNDYRVVAVSIYIASNLTGDPRSPREISGVIDDVDTSYIHAAFDQFTNWDEIVDDEIRSEVHERFDIQTLVWPPSSLELTRRECDLEYLADVCTQYCHTLAMRDCVAVMARRIASRVWNITTLRHVRRDRISLAAACVYMAGHLMRDPRDFEAVCAVSNRVSVSETREIYQLVYAARWNIVRESWPTVMSRNNMTVDLRL